MKDSERLLLAILTVGCVLFFNTRDFAQQRQPDRGFQAGNTYAASDIETINTTNGNLMLNIPLASLPSGRGTSPGFTVSLNYNSKLLDAKQINKTDGINGNPNYHLELLNQSEAGGWRFSLAHRLKLTTRGETEAQQPCQDSWYLQKDAYIYKINVESPDGSLTEFVPIGYTQQYSDGYYNISPFGVQGGWSYNTVGEESGSCTYGTTRANSTGMNYTATDGSGIRLFIPPIEQQPTGQPQAIDTARWALYYPDGKVIEHFPADNSSVFERLTDRNGNQVVIKSDTFNGSAATKIEDNAGHFIIIQGDTIYSQGVGGALLPTVLNWKYYYVYRRYKATVDEELNANPDQREQDLVINNLPMLDSITLPPQAGSLKYEFAYNAAEGTLTSGNYTLGWGEVKSVTLPSGAKAEYKYSVYDTPPSSLRNFDVLNSYVTEKTLTYKENYDGTETTKTDKWKYYVAPTSSYVINPDGSGTIQYFENTRENITPMSGVAYKTGLANGTIIERIFDTPTQVKTEFSTPLQGQGGQRLTAIKDYTYDLNGNPTSIKEYDFVDYNSVPRSSGDRVTGIPAGAVLKRETVNEYYNPLISNFDSSKKLKGVIKATEIRNGAGTVFARSEFSYDDADNTGNLTQTRVWDSTKSATLGSADGYGNKLNLSNAIFTTVAYNSYGSPTLITDANGYQTQITYGAISGPNGDVTGLYPTQTIAAFNTPIQRTSTAQYDFYTGLATSSTDVDNNVTSGTEYDALGRPKTAKAAVGTSKEIWTQTEYNDAARRIISRSDLFVKGDAKKVAIQYYDQLGRVFLTRALEDSATQSATNISDGIKVQTRYGINDPTPNNPSDPENSTGGFVLVSNPYRAATAAGATNEPSMGWSRSKSNSAGNHSESETFSGASLPAPWGTNTNSSGMVSTDADSDRTLVTDQAGKQRISRTNALGQLTDVWEVTASDASTVAVSFPNQALSAGYQTSYQYDTLNNLTTVTQGSQTRTFAYSSLSRLTSAINPESGTVGYTYDNNGNLTQKTDARSIQTNYAYDALNRVTQRSYSDGVTPTVTYTYDNGTNARGKLTKVSSTVSTTEYTSFDILGRVLAQTQTTDGAAYTTAYGYNLAGGLLTETYPSGRVVKNVLDNNGDLSIVQSKKNSLAGYWNYAQHFSFTAAGAVSSMQLGNGKWESTVFNNRLQPTQIALGTVQNGTDNLKLDFDYGTTTNNGNVQSQTITVPTETRGGTTYNAFTATQNYTYDSLNRLHSAQETLSGQNGGWQQTYKYDRFGNRNFDQANTTTLPKNCQSGSAPIVCAGDVPIYDPAVSAADNRLSGYSYDSAGNTKINAAGQTFTYDAENKQTKVQSGSTVIGEYSYDGDGKRVKKYVPSTGETTIFVYDASGKMVAEYSTVVASAADAKVSYLTTDSLGSPRITTDANGAVTSRRDFMPFGEEIARASYGTDTVRQKFTSYERDNETEDDFAQARYYNYKFGRFNSVDPLLSTGEPNDPQTWNRYAYALNSPLYLTDPSGMYVCKGNTEQCEQFTARLSEAKEYLKKVGEKYGVDSDKYKQVSNALNSYGEDETGKDKNNGVFVSFDRKKSGGNTQGNFDKDGKLTGINVSLNAADLKNKSFQAVVGHEGDHVDYFQTVGNNTTDKRNFEFRGHFVESLLGEAQFGQFANGRYWVTDNKGKEYDIWNSSWEGPDRETLRAKAINTWLDVPINQGGYAPNPPKPKPTRRRKRG